MIPRNDDDADLARPGRTAMIADAEGWRHELEVALAAAAAAAEILRSRAGARPIREKGRADLVTEVDEASERAIAEMIRGAFPDDGFIAEELSAVEVATGRRWIVDPLDGTINYVHGHPFACVSIALVDDRGPAVGVIHAPFLNEIYVATRGGGARLNDRPLTVSPVERLDESLLATGFPFKPGKGDPSTYFDLVEELVLTTHGVRRAGAAALDLAYVACGRVEAFFEIGLAPWDVAAGILLVTEAGGIVTPWPGDPRPALETGRVLASNGRIHSALEDVIRPYVGKL